MQNVENMSTLKALLGSCPLIGEIIFSQFTIESKMFFFLPILLDSSNFTLCLALGWDGSEKKSNLDPSNIKTGLYTSKNVVLAKIDYKFITVHSGLANKT